MRKITFKIACCYGNEETTGYVFRFNGFRLVVHRNIIGEGKFGENWSVSLYSNGCNISCGHTTIKEAIAACKERICKNGIRLVKKAISKHPVINQ
ncbi:MAG TPA: hypothetical protein ENH82_05225 [bacterium]|nr:hypothetical protein [bacterium]